MIQLDLDDILRIHQIVIEETGGDNGILDIGLIESALNSTEAGFGNYQKYVTVEEKAARLCYGIVMNHGFVDGNKRAGTNAMLTMLKINGIDMCYSPKELANIILNLATGSIGYIELLEWTIFHEKA